MATKKPSHRWSFYRAGGVDQVRLERGADILRIGKLDQKLWVALSCPVKGLEFDERTLELLDTDGDGRVRAPELINAVEWLGACLQNPDELTKRSATLPLSSIKSGRPEGEALLNSANYVLDNLDKADATEITVDDAAKAAETVKEAELNGDGIVPPANIEDEAARKLAEEIIACVGGADDRSGEVGVGQEQVDAFYEACAQFDEWWKAGEADRQTTLPLGEDTIAAHAALEAARAKVEDYFGRCALAAYDPRAQTKLNREEDSYIEVAASDLSLSADQVSHFPLAMIEADKPLPLEAGVNPAWKSAIADLRKKCVDPLLGAGKTSLSQSDWSDLVGKFAGFTGWNADKKGADVESLGITRVREILSGKDKETLASAIESDLAMKDEVDAITNLERLTRYYRDIHELLTNFVSFEQFYAREEAIFQAGTLYLDGRSCDLCFRVDNPATHAKLATMSKIYLAYCDCTRPSSGDKMSIVAAFTNGDSDNLFVGRNGLFYDRDGKDWDATITKIVDNPISVRQAFFSPYKKLIRWIESAVAKRAAAADSSATAKLQSGATSAAKSATTGKAEGKPKFDVGVVAALGVAVGGITAAIGGIMQAFFGLGIWMPLGVLGLILLISGPSMLIAWLKLRQRNLGPILDANGWAVNTLTKVNIPLGTALTDRATLPKDADRTLKDPFAPKKPWWPKILLTLILLGGAGYGTWYFGYLEEWFPGKFPAPPERAKKAEGEGKNNAENKDAKTQKDDKTQKGK